MSTMLNFKKIKSTALQDEIITQPKQLISCILDSILTISNDVGNISSNINNISSLSNDTNIIKQDVLTISSSISGIVIDFNQLVSNILEKYTLIPTLNTKYKYTGDIQKINIPENIYYRVSADSELSAKDIGTYHVALELNEGYFWFNTHSNDVQTIEWEIVKAENEWLTEPSIDKTEWHKDEHPCVLTEGIAKFGNVTILLNGVLFNNKFPTEVGNYVLGFVIEGNNNYTGLYKEIKFEILAIDMSNYNVCNYAELLNQTYTYDNTTIFYDINTLNYSVSGTTFATNAGIYTVTVKLNEGCIWLDETFEDKIITWSITQAENEWLTEPSIDKTEWRKGTTPGTLTNGVAKFGEIKITLDGEDYDITNPLPTEPGEYTLEFIVEGTDNYNRLIKTINFEILEIKSLDQSVFENLSKIYNGNQQNIIITDESDNYTVGGIIKATDVGEYSFTITPKDGYKWNNSTSDKQKTFTWSITQAENIWIPEPSIDKTEWKYDTTPGTLTKGVAKFGNVIMQLNGETIDALPTEPGEYTLEFIVEGNDNYTRLYKEISFKILSGYLCFTAEEAGSTIKMSRNSTSTPTVYLETSPTGEEGSWSKYTVNSTKITLANVGDKIYFRAKQDNTHFATNISNYNYFVMTGKIAASGNLNTLLKADGSVVNLTKQYCYYKMFWNCKSLTKAPELPATTLTNSCYRYMFYGCTSLTQAPSILPATTLAEYCYGYMFRDCTSLIQAPTINATSLANKCCYEMFYGCSSLTQAPELPATILAEYCYYYMFYGCTSLTQAPSILPATTLAEYCYGYMFRDCTSLIQAPELPATTLASKCYRYMFYNCTKLNTINVNFSSWKVGSSIVTSNWTYNVTSTGTFTCPADLSKSRGTNYIPSSWTIVEKN